MQWFDRTLTPVRCRIHPVTRCQSMDRLILFRKILVRPILILPPDRVLRTLRSTAELLASFDRRGGFTHATGKLDTGPTAAILDKARNAALVQVRRCSFADIFRFEWGESAWAKPTNLSTSVSEVGREAHVADHYHTGDIARRDGSASPTSFGNTHRRSIFTKCEAKAATPTAKAAFPRKLCKRPGCF